MKNFTLIIDKAREAIESTLTKVQEIQDDIVHIKMDQLKGNEKIADIVSKVQVLNEQYSGQVYDGLKIVNALIAQKSKEMIERFSR